VALDGIDASKLGTITRTDGSMQVTYFGWPLYYFAKDATPGDAMGQNMSDLWHVISPTGDQITK
jgi:predicted lipoprotein with Yx(FWY)xxD motif